MSDSGLNSGEGGPWQQAAEEGALSQLTFTKSYNTPHIPTVLAIFFLFSKK